MGDPTFLARPSNLSMLRLILSILSFQDRVYTLVEYENDLASQRVAQGNRDHWQHCHVAWRA